MLNDKMVVLCSDRGLPNKTQVFVEHPPMLASKVRFYVSILKQIRSRLRETYPTAKCYFYEVDAFEKPILDSE